jgi:hypothetical protein
MIILYYVWALVLSGYVYDVTKHNIKPDKLSSTGCYAREKNEQALILTEN